MVEQQIGVVGSLAHPEIGVFHRAHGLAVMDPSPPARWGRAPIVPCGRRGYLRALGCAIACGASVRDLVKVTRSTPDPVVLLVVPAAEVVAPEARREVEAMIAAAAKDGRRWYLVPVETGTLVEVRVVDGRIVGDPPTVLPVVYRTPAVPSSAPSVPTPVPQPDPVAEESIVPRRRVEAPVSSDGSPETIAPPPTKPRAPKRKAPVIDEA